MLPWSLPLGPSSAPTPSGTARRPRLTTPPRIPRPSAAREGAFRGRGWSRPSPDWLLRARQPQFSALWRRGWREQLAPCGPLRPWDSPEGGRPLGQKRSWEGGLRAETGTARGEPGSSNRQVGVKDPAGARRGRAGAEAVRTRGGLELERSVRAARPGQARASRSRKFAATAAVLGGFCSSQGGEERETAVGRRRPAPSSPEAQGGGGRGGRGSGRRSEAALLPCPPE